VPIFNIDLFALFQLSPATAAFLHFDGLDLPALLQLDIDFALALHESAVITAVELGLVVCLSDLQGFERIFVEV